MIILVATRPYELHSEADLLDLRRRFEDALRQIDREVNEYGRRAGPGYQLNAGYDEIVAKRRLPYDEISAIDRELAMRREGQTT
jgi:hypothetical protein